MDQIKIGEYLKQLRRDKALTQEQLAEQLGVSARTVSRWETGSNLPELGMLESLSEALGTDVSEVVKSGSPARESISAPALALPGKRRFSRVKLAGLILLTLIAVLFLSYEIMKHSFQSRVIDPLTKAAYAEYNAEAEGEFGGRTFYRSVEVDGAEAALSIRVPAGSRFSAVYVLRRTQPVTVGGSEYYLDVNYSEDMFPWDDRYFVGVVSDGEASTSARGFELYSDGRLHPDTRPEVTPQEKALLSELEQYYLPMLERIKSERTHIYETY